MTRQKRALVFSGGGGKGGYQIGVWKALDELGFKPDIVVGTSVGALNGALVALQKLDVAEIIWNNMSMERVFTRFSEDPETKELSSEEKRSLLIKEILTHKGADMEPLHQLVSENMDEAFLRSSPVEFGLVTTQFPNLKPIKLFVSDMPEGSITDYIMASAACFPFTKTKKIGDMNYIDGGYSQNMPIQMAIERGAREIVVVDIGGIPDTTFIADEVKIHYVRSKHLFNENSFKQTLTFDKDLSQEYMRCGYLDCLQEFRKIDGCNYYFEYGEKYNIKEYEALCASIFEKIYSCLPGEKRTEKMSRLAVSEYLNKIVENPFQHYSNVILCCEAAATVLSVDTEPVYTIEELASLVLNKLIQVQTTLNTEPENGIIAHLTETIPVLGIFEKEKLLYEVYMMILTESASEEEIEKKKVNLWTIGIAAPEIIAAAVFSAAAHIKSTKKEGE